ncbi:dihydrodipicolinate reductase [Paenibacillus vortex V453]|jgi:4-hydroxy-tetrahydrodipicolinate reductase|uniref:4-hydroxy-tetrahydrodipicolinate reductase n=1 Tax=Paenibacillus vortex V453 TaxID=715225 RepID=A0A2R9SVP5_9BACL|nr:MULTISPECIES: 4-hydroxy-tetrahydrodipicolinate reductase [Paenibacillus]ANA82064.1 4-hydroxy-tetrahydrodipicolinate reductase [Paenibacillus glucanolyticus]AVV59198.1 4-hydroxy-tetrahydrodipicolinate reductase [Paenibacillus glucanolyticus]EFU41420.1 dihydrodipicolinate reductase [Paenibacillus vortex V453]ETT43506.1 dihydrodipicolinate reductase [Paenibacillus sp. FSL R5-808]MPY16283.1 4-hydroxy-tetrahydrodipicolinate reductase [Paenibacillus glucanolyticus]
MANKMKVAVVGAGGRMGKEVVKLVLGDEELELVAAVGKSDAGADAGTLVGLPACGIRVTSDLEMALVESRPDVMVDFTTPQFAYSNTALAIKHGVRPIIGTTGFTPEQIEELDKQCAEQNIGGLIAPNFSIGAILMMKFAAQAAKYLPHVEIIETHGDQKLDAPSGTSIKTAEMIAQNREEIRQGNPKEEEVIEGARGGYYNGFRIHSVRLPGVFAQQEVIFGGYGQSLKIRHDSYERAAYMPGVKMAMEKVMSYTGLVYGFDHFID